MASLSLTSVSVLPRASAEPGSSAFASSGAFADQDFRRCSTRLSHSRRTRVRAATTKCGIAEPSGAPAPMGKRTKYNDSWFDVFFMRIFASKMDNFIDGSTPRTVEGYDDFVDTSRRVMRGRSPSEQREIVGQVLLSLMPPNAPATFRRLFPPTKWAAEVNAAITVPFFQWLVGPAQLTEVEVNGVKQWSGVQISKCRYLESSGCVGMCVNMCKLPTQDFFTDQFGLPLTMTPNYEDMSCEMIFGQMPPPLSEDPALQQQPCFKDLCSMAKPEAPRCPSLIVP